jgi:glc operon protein GlcG
MRSLSFAKERSMRWFIHMSMVVGLTLTRAVAAQLPQRYVLTSEAATRIAAAAEAEAVRNGWSVVIAVVDAGGHLVHLRRMDGAQLGSLTVAQEKANAAVLFRRPTKVFADRIAAGEAALLRLPGMIPIEGGLPLAVAGQVVGAIGVSGATSAQDGQIAEVGARALAGPPGS